MHELVTIPFSHFCEKARFALERYGVAYRERRYLPLVHLPAVALHGRGGGAADGVSSRWSTPLLITERGERIRDSSSIVRWVDEHAAGGALGTSQLEVASLEAAIGRRLGPHLRRLVYFHLFQQPELLSDLARRNTDRGQSLIFSAARRLAGNRLAARLGGDESAAARSERITWEEADKLAERLSDGRPFLFGESFGAADLAAACLFAPLVLPREYGAILPELSQLDSALRSVIERARAHPLGEFTARVFREERARR